MQISEDVIRESIVTLSYESRIFVIVLLLIQKISKFFTNLPPVITMSVYKKSSIIHKENNKRNLKCFI